MSKEIQYLKIKNSLLKENLHLLDEYDYPYYLRLKEHQSIHQIEETLRKVSSSRKDGTAPSPQVEAKTAENIQKLESQLERLKAKRDNLERDIEEVKEDIKEDTGHKFLLEQEKEVYRNPDYTKILPDYDEEIRILKAELSRLKRSGTLTGWGEVGYAAGGGGETAGSSGTSGTSGLTYASSGSAGSAGSAGSSGSTGTSGSAGSSGTDGTDAILRTWTVTVE